MIGVAAVLAKTVLPIVALAWGVAVAIGDYPAAVVGGVLSMLIVVAIVRSDRLRGKRAEGGP